MPKRTIVVSCDNEKCKSTYKWIVPERYDITKDCVCKKCKKGTVKEVRNASTDSKDK